MVVLGFVDLAIAGNMLNTFESGSSDIILLGYCALVFSRSIRPTASWIYLLDISVGVYIVLKVTLDSRVLQKQLTEISENFFSV